MIDYKRGHNGNRHVDETKLDKEEAVAFIKFLEAEVQRHKTAIRDNYDMLLRNHLPEVSKIAYESSIAGHQDDVKNTQRTIDYLKDKWKV